MGGNSPYYDENELVCSVSTPVANYMPNDGIAGYLPLPAQTNNEAIEFLSLMGGGTAGAGQAMRRIGIEAPVIRARYKQAVEKLAQQIAQRLKNGESIETVARWASEQRRQIVREIRAGTGRVAQVLYEVRDWKQYGRGGRTYSNLMRYYQGRGIPNSAIPGRILDGATRSNVNINQAMRGASYLKHGGGILIVVGVTVSAARIWNASDEELPKVIGEELGGFVGGSLGAGAGVGVCLLFGIASGGWGLLACGAIGGVLGGMGGSTIGRTVSEGIYFSNATTPDHLISDVIIEVPIDQIYSQPPDFMCQP